MPKKSKTALNDDDPAVPGDRVSAIAVGSIQTLSPSNVSGMNGVLQHSSSGNEFYLGQRSERRKEKRRLLGIVDLESQKILAIERELLKETSRKF